MNHTHKCYVLGLAVIRCTHIYLATYILYSVEVTISFNQRTYIVNEYEGLLQAVLVLSTSVRTDITVQVETNDNTATGEHLTTYVLSDDMYFKHYRRRC